MTQENILTDQEVDMAIKRAEYQKLNKLSWIAKISKRKTKVPTDAILTEDEREKVLELENNLKHSKRYFDAICAENRAKAEKADQELTEKWTYKAFVRLMRAMCRKVNGSPLVENETSLPLIKALSFRFGKDPRYETELGYSFKKGLIIRGGVGLGKSFLVSLIKDNPVNKVQIITMPEVDRQIKENGEFRGINYSKYETIFLDDVGKQTSEINHYGTVSNWFKTFIEHYYANSPFHFHRLIISTNDSFEQMEKMYGKHVRDRMREKFDVINIKGKSMR